MAAQNMVNAVRGHLIHQQRPLYLQPVNENGEYPWEKQENVGSAEDKASQLTVELKCGSSSASTNYSPRQSDESELLWEAMDVDGVATWGYGLLMETEDQCKQAPEPSDDNTNLSTCSNKWIPENDQDDFHKSHKRLASEEVEAIRAILRKALRRREE